MTTTERDSRFFEALPAAQRAARQLCGRLYLSETDRDDAEQEASLAILFAALRFDPSHDRSNWTFFVRKRVWGALKHWLHKRPLVHPTCHNRQDKAHVCIKSERGEKALATIAAPTDDQSAFLDEITAAIKRLPPSYQDVVVKRFGLDGKGERTLAELGQEAGGLTREAIRQREKKALARLRGGLNK